MATNEVITKLNRIIDGLMGVKINLAFRKADELSASDWRADDLALFSERPDSAPSYIEDSTSRSYGFPVNLQGSFAGLAVVEGWTGVRPRQLVLLAELVTSMLERGLADEERRERLRTIEERLLSMDKNASNVIALRPSRFGKVLQITDNGKQAVPGATPLTSLPLLIETKKGFPLHRIAVEIHQLSNRWALVNLADLPKEVLDTREGLKDLGAISLFIPDLSKLSMEQQAKLAEYLATKPGLDMPHVIAGLPTPEAEEIQVVLPLLLEQFCLSQLQWTDKTPEEISRNFIHASLEHLLEVARETVKEGEYYLPFHVQHLDPEHPSWH